MSHHGFFEMFLVNIRGQASIFFSLRIFFSLYRYTHSAWETKMYSLELVYFQGCKYRGGVKCLWECEGTPTISLVLYTINVEYMCDASYATWKYRQYRKFHVIFVEKIQKFSKKKYTGARFDSSGTQLFNLFTVYIGLNKFYYRHLTVHNNISTGNCLTVQNIIQ